MGRDGKEKYRLKRSAGFTTVELIMVISTIAVLTAAFLFTYDSVSTESAIARDQLIADIRQCQLRAMSLGSQQSIVFAVGSSVYTIPDEQKRLPKDITVGSTNLVGNTLTFNTAGEPTFPDTNKTISLSSGEVITVSGVSGRAE